MADTTKGSTALVERPSSMAAELAARFTTNPIKTASDLVARIRDMREQAFILSPVTGGAIAPGYEIAVVPEVIDPSVDPESGCGADVYHQRSIHKGHKQGDRWVPDEVSLNHYALLRILGNAGVNVHPTRWLQDGVRERYIWVCETDGDLIDFTGQLRMLPTGIGSMDARDGSDEMDGWTPEAWMKACEAAEQERKQRNLPKDKAWQVKPAILKPDGSRSSWTAERVQQVRTKGRQIVKSKSLNGLARKLGVRQSYTIAELTAKPFIVLRPVFMPDMSDPDIRKMVTAAHLGARHLLYPGASRQEIPALADATVTHEPHEVGQTMDGNVVEQFVADPEPPERMETAGLPQDAEELEDEKPAAVETPQVETYHVVKVVQRGKGEAAQYFAETKEGQVLYTPDLALAKALKAAATDGQPRAIPTERVLVSGAPYRQAIEVASVGRLL